MFFDWNQTDMKIVQLLQLPATAPHHVQVQLHNKILWEGKWCLISVQIGSSNASGSGQTGLQIIRVQRARRNVLPKNNKKIILDMHKTKATQIQLEQIAIERSASKS